MTNNVTPIWTHSKQKILPVQVLLETSNYEEVLDALSITEGRAMLFFWKKVPSFDDYDLFGVEDDHYVLVQPQYGVTASYVAKEIHELMAPDGAVSQLVDDNWVDFAA
jgi:hypothetical protein